MHTALRSVFCSCFTLLLFNSLPTQAQDSIDDGFHIQGEYIGYARIGGRGRRYTGLQVVARGAGKFDAVLYRGGLPGAGWDRETKSKLSGQRDEQGVTLVGGDVTLQLASDGSQWRAVVQRNGAPIGTLRKIFRISPTMGASPARGAVVLFGGGDPEHLENATATADGLINVLQSRGGFWTKDPVGDFRLHGEFRTPYEPAKSGQGRGNSGFYLQRRYEVQVLDSFGLEGVHNECGGLYKQKAPDVNMALPPLSWQTYDIFFTAARFDDKGNKTANARITVLHNGVRIHDNYEITNKTGAGRPEGPDPLPILWQNHSNPVHYRNIWIVHDPASMSDDACCKRRMRNRGRFRLFRRRS